MVYQIIDTPPMQPFMTRREVESTFHDSHKQASVRKVAIKVASFICCPCVWSGMCVLCFSATCYDLCREGDCYEDFKRDCFHRKRSSELVCKYSTCEFEPVWQAAEPPTSKCDLIQLIFDPCIYCCCFTRENENNYLLPQERQNLERAKTAIRILDHLQTAFVINIQTSEIPNLVLQGLSL